MNSSSAPLSYCCSESLLAALRKRAMRLHTSTLQAYVHAKWRDWDDYLRDYHQLIVALYDAGIATDAGPVQPLPRDRIANREQLIGHEKRKLLEIASKSLDIACHLEYVYQFQTKAPADLPADREAAMSRVIGICNGFHVFLTRLNSTRTHSKASISDESDVQRYLYALFAVDFHDVRVEEWTPSYSGAASRMDFLLMPFGIVVECKMTRRTLGDKQIGEELLIDIAKYKKHPEAKRLVCFIYDPKGLIRNGAQMSRDLETGTFRRLPVKVIIRPTGH